MPQLHICNTRLDTHDKRLMINRRLLHMSATNQHPTKRPNAAVDARRTTTNQHPVDNSELGVQSGAIAT
jgi:hypothetical protein